MIVPAIQKIREMPAPMSVWLRKIIRSLVQNGFVTHNLGMEATEECLESFYDQGRIKISLEPSDSKYILGRVMLYDDSKGMYYIAERLEIIAEIPKG